MIDTKEKRRLEISSKTSIEHKTIPEIKEISKIRKTRFRNLFIFLIFAITVITAYLIVYEKGTHELTKERVKKFERAIRRTVKRKHKKIDCEQYVLKAAKSAWYPLLSWGVAVAQDSIWLNKGEVWKYGITCLGELRRYSGQIYYNDGKILLTRNELDYEIQLRGTEKECKIEEKTKIYNYPLLPECMVRKKKLARPPGHKNDN